MSKISPSRSPIRKDGDGERKSYSYSYKYGYGYAGYKKEARPRKLNLWLLISTIVLLAIAGPALYFWHSHQITRLSDSLLAHADEMAAQEKWREASDAYYRVWEIRKDPELLGKLTPAYDKHAASRDPMGVIASYQRAVGALPERLDLKERLSELLLQVGQHQLALEQAEKSLELDPNSKAAMKWRALSLLGLQRSGQTVDANVLDELKKAFISQQDDFDLAFGLIGHLRRDLDAESDSEYARQADAVINRLVGASPNNASAYLARYQYRTKYGVPGAKQDLDQAIMIAPDNPVVVQKGAWDALRDAVKTKGSTGNYLATRQLFLKLIELQPENPSGYVGLGDAEYLVRGDIERAIKIWQDGREKAGDSLPLLLRIVEGQTNLYKYQDAESTIREVDNFLSTLSSKGSEGDRKWATASAALFRGKINLANNQPYQAVPQFQLAAELGNANDPNRIGTSTAYTALMALGKTYTKLGQLKDAAASYDRALLLQADSEPAMLLGAEAWASLGDLDRAIRVTERALRAQQVSPEASRYLAQYLLEKEVAKPEEERDWTDFEEAFMKARWLLADSWKLRLIDVDYAVRRNQNDEDISLILGKLLSIESDFPDEIQVWRRLPFIYESLGLTSETDRALNRLEEITSSSPETKFVLVDVLLSRGKHGESQTVLDGIAGDQLTPQEEWLRDLAQLRVIESSGDATQVDGQIVAYIQKYPMNVSLVERLLDRRLCGASSTSVPTTPQLLTKLKERQSNADGNWQYYEARLQLLSQKPDMELVRSHLASLRNRLPYWSRTQELAGRVALIDSDTREARIAFDDAVSKPKPNPELLDLLIQQNLDSSDYMGAVQLVRKQRQFAPLSRLLTSNWSELQERLDFALVEQGLEEKSPAHEMLWKSTIEDVDIDEFIAEHPDDMAGMILSLAQKKDKNEIASLLSQITKHRFESNDERVFVLGQAFELASDFKKATQFFGQVHETSPYRFKAELYAGRVNERSTRKTSIASSSLASSKTRLEAILLLRRAGKNDLKKAQSLLESIVDTPSPDLNDRLLLASCLEKVNDPDAAKAQLLTVVNAAPSAQHLSVLIDFLLRDGRNDEAQVWIEQLEDQTGWSKAAVGLRTRWMAATNRQAEIKAFVENYAQQRFERSPDDIPGEMIDIAKIYRDVNMTADAKRWLSLLASRFPNQAEPLSFLLVENDETERAIQRCVKQLHTSPSASTAALLARILVYGNVSHETMNQVKPLLDKSLEKYPNNGNLLFALGNLQLKQGKKQQAIDMLTKVTEVQPGHYLAWNNLAALLAEEQGRQDDAMSTINKAISYAAYDVPTLLDTKAVVLMHQQEYDEAVELLQTSVTDSRSASDPRFYFHLAMSLERLGDVEAAKSALADANDLDLAEAFLTEFEKQELKRLQAKFSE